MLFRSGDGNAAVQLADVPDAGAIYNDDAAAANANAANDGSAANASRGHGAAKTAAVDANGVWLPATTNVVPITNANANDAAIANVAAHDDGRSALDINDDEWWLTTKERRKRR